MKINRINSVQNFGKAIKLYPYSVQSGEKLNNLLNEVCNVLNSKPSNLYTESQAEKIRTFFGTMLSDYNGKDGILFRKSEDGDIVLLSGKDANAIRRLEKRKIYIGEDIVERVINKEINKRLQISSNENEEAVINLYSDNTRPCKIFNRFSYGQMYSEYGEKSNGVIKKASENTKRNKKVVYKVDYEETSIEI